MTDDECQMSNVFPVPPFPRSPFGIRPRFSVGKERCEIGEFGEIHAGFSQP